MSLLSAQLPDAAGAYVFCLPSKRERRTDEP